MNRKLLLLTSILFAACNVDHNLGDTDQLPDAATGNGTSTNTDTGTGTGTNSASESWTGYVENFKFGSGSDAVKLVLATNTAGQVSGTVTFGNGIAPPPATDPSVAYPPGMGQTITTPNTFLEGPAFAIKSGSLQTSRLSLTVDSMDIWTDWCAIQPAPTDGSSICVPEDFITFTGNQDRSQCYLTPRSGDVVTIDCYKWDLCFMSRVCRCSPSGCVTNGEDSGYKISFDLFLTNGTGSGSMKGVFGSYNVHFTKD